MPHVKIFKPSRNAMQSGRGKSTSWIIEHEHHELGSAEPLMGWSPSTDTLNQVKLKFKTKDDAVSFAEKKGWDYTIIESNERQIKPKNYSDNFK